MLDLAVERADKGWSGYLVSGVRDLVFLPPPKVYRRSTRHNGL